MGRAKKNDGEVDFMEPGMGHNVKEISAEIIEKGKEIDGILDEISALHDKKNEIYAYFKAAYGLERKNVEWAMRLKKMDIEQREKDEKQRVFVCEALGVPFNAVQPDMFGGEDQPVNSAPLAGKDAAAEQSATVQ